MSENSNVLTISVVNLVLFIVLTIFINFNNATAANLDLKNNTIADSVMTNISSVIDSKLGTIVENDTNITPSDFLPDKLQTAVADATEKWITLTKPLGKVLQFIAAAAFPGFIMHQALVDSASMPITKTIMSLFIWTWQTITIVVWGIFILGFRAK